MRKIFMLLILFSSILTVGCSNNLEGDSLLLAPKLPIEVEEVKSILSENFSKELDLINPIIGESNNSIQFVDLDNDGKDEVLVFHKVKDDKFPVRIAILTKISDTEWIVNNTIKGIGYDVNKIVYSDMDNDGIKEIIVGWQGGTILNKGLSIYSYSKGDISETYEDTYTEFDVKDFTSDGTKELMIIKLNRSEGVSKAFLYDYKNSAVSFIDETLMDGYINNYYHVTSGNAYNGLNGMFLDASVGAHSAFTDLLVYQNGELKNIFYDENWSSTNTTFKAYPRKSKDIDSDGTIEIPILIAPKGYENASMSDTPWLTVWYKWDGKKDLIRSNESYQDFKHGFEFVFPNDWDKHVTLEFARKNNSLIKFTLDDDEKTQILDILILSSEEYESMKEKPEIKLYKKIKTTFKKVYLLRQYIYDNSNKYYLDEDRFKELLKINYENNKN
ncbi:hypothetical protein [Helicovermis profundi]|uniref:VCBS repeat-containing protein n=1 Tax=Helicovermis profundi TaxID=3065157 RepID=A0AAU9E0Z8_9FIRM|nr:hypothetical protein HLPR_04200 [Clostridia bacterium S502]